MEKTVGNTPLIKILYEYKGKISYFYTKLEFYNITGSIKDRVAWYIVEKAKNRGILKKGMSIIEATSGNTGIALSAIGAKEGYPVTIFMPNWVSKERVDLMKSYGANVILISKEQGGFLKCIEEAKKLAKETNGYHTNQFSNIDNMLAHYETTGKEIVNQLKEEIGAFISGVGTGGTLMGIGKRIKEVYPESKIIALEPDKMPLLSGKEIKEQHKIEGIGDEFIPELINKEEIDKIFLINDDDSVNMARKIAKELGIGVGISSGANALASILAKEETEEAVVTVFSDDNKKYLSTDLEKEIDNNKEFISNKIQLLDYEVIS